MIPILLEVFPSFRTEEEGGFFFFFMQVSLSSTLSQLKVLAKKRGRGGGEERRGEDLSQEEEVGTLNRSRLSSFSNGLPPTSLQRMAGRKGKERDFAAWFFSIPEDPNNIFSEEQIKIQQKINGFCFLLSSSKNLPRKFFIIWAAAASVGIAEEKILFLSAAFFFLFPVLARKTFVESKKVSMEKCWNLFPLSLVCCLPPHRPTWNASFPLGFCPQGSRLIG